MDTTSVAISVVSPFYNKSALLDGVIRKMVATLNMQFGEDWEFILVNDGSTDNSLEVAQDAIRSLTCPRIRLLSLPWNFGRGRALKSGIDAAQGKIIVTTEADGSWGEDIINRLYDTITADPRVHCVVASVHLPGGGLVNVPFQRVLLTTIGNWIIRTLFVSDISMNTGMTRAYRREVIQPLITEENGKEFHLEVLLKLNALDFKIVEIPATITWPERPCKGRISEKHRSTTNIPQTINSHLRFAAMANPVRNFSLLAATCFLGSCFFLIWALINLITREVSVNLALISLFLMLFTFVLVGFTIIFHQMSNSLRIQWSKPYKMSCPPSVVSAQEISLGGPRADV